MTLRSLITFLWSVYRFNWRRRSFCCFLKQTVKGLSEHCEEESSQKSFSVNLIYEKFQISLWYSSTRKVCCRRYSRRGIWENPPDINPQTSSTTKLSSVKRKALCQQRLDAWLSMSRLSYGFSLAFHFTDRDALHFRNLSWDGFAASSFHFLNLESRFNSLQWTTLR